MGQGFCDNASATSRAKVAVAQTLGDFAVGECRAGGDATRDFVNAPMELR